MSPRVGISACLLGAEVRYDGRHKRDASLLDELGPHVEWVPVCPEMEVGMGVPREPVQLVAGTGGRTLMLGVDSGTDWTERMNDLARARADELAAKGLSGFVLKSRSPSCGLEGVGPHGVGLFAAALMRRLPDLPVEEEIRLADAQARQGFLRRVHAYARANGL